MSGRNGAIERKSFAFAVRVINLYKFLKKDKREFVMSKQLLRSGTAIGALVAEAVNAESKRDFIHKLGIAQKECGESIYWLRLLNETKFVTEIQSKSMITDSSELLKMLRSSIMTARKNI